MFGLAKKADVDISTLIANGIKRIPQMDDLANLAIVANAKNKQNQIQNDQQENPPKLKG